MSTFSTYRKSGATATYPEVTPVERYSLHFEGTTYVNTQFASFNVNLFDSLIATDISKSFWIKIPDVDGDVHQIISAGYSVFTIAISLMVTGDGKLQSIYASDYSGGLAIISNSSIDDDAWHHIVVTWDKDVGGIIYIDGEVDSSEADTIATNIDISGTGQVGKNSFLAYWPSLVGFNFNDFAMWDVKLSAEDVTSIYNSGTPNDLTNAASYDTDRTSELEVYWKMEEGSGTTVADSSSNSYTLTFSAAPEWSTDIP